MRMNFNIINTIRNLELPLDELVIIGKSALVLHDVLHHVDKVDIICTQKCADIINSTHSDAFNYNIVTREQLPKNYVVIGKGYKITDLDSLMEEYKDSDYETYESIVTYLRKYKNRLTQLYNKQKELTEILKRGNLKAVDEFICENELEDVNRKLAMIKKDYIK